MYSRCLWKRKMKLGEEKEELGEDEVKVATAFGPICSLVHFIVLVLV